MHPIMLIDETIHDPKLKTYLHKMNITNNIGVSQKKEIFEKRFQALKGSLVPRGLIIFPTGFKSFTYTEYKGCLLFPDQTYQCQTID
ncbi:MAG: hypothetical protein H6622_13955 [Halobacteriovoraceae bacterium]|nr:hypothetical protein [Halobacteriovoraceae bacterium]